MKTNRINFTLKDYESGKYKVVTRVGKRARIVCTDMKSYQPIIAIVRETEDVELYSSFSLKGELNEEGKKDGYDLFLEETVFEDGDIISFGEIDSSVICIFKNSEKHGYKNHAALTPDNEITYSDCLWVTDDIRLATEEEKQRLFDALKKDGKRWNAEKKCIEDIKEECKLKPFQKVLVRYTDNDAWKANMFSHFIDGTNYKYICIDSGYKQCIPYEGNEKLLGTINKPKQ